MKLYKVHAIPKGLGNLLVNPTEILKDWISLNSLFLEPI